MIISLLRCGGFFLVVSNPPPDHAQVALVLQGSSNGVRARCAEAMNLLQQGVIDQVLISLPEQSYWGESIPEVAHHYLESRYGSALTHQVAFCATNDSVGPTDEEAQTLRRCLEKHT